MSLEYDIYLAQHKANVQKGFEWLTEHLPEVVGNIGEWNTRFAHDASKTDLDEYKAYDAYFYGGNRSYQVLEDFNKAWLLHIHRNPHHWQYWVLINDDPENGVIMVDIPDEYIIEMICDWWSFSWKSGNLFEIFDWYEKHKDHIKLSDFSRQKVESILELMREELNKET